MQELFTLGAGDGYTEIDVREHARALTGWTNSWNQATGQPKTSTSTRPCTTTASRSSTAIAAASAGATACGSCSSNPGPPQVLRHEAVVLLLRQSRCRRKDTRAAEALYVSSGKQIRPVVEAMLMHPLVHAGPRMVKPPIVQIAGMLRGIGRYIDTDAWAWESTLAGQTPFYPPNVGGWEADALAEHRHLAGALQPRRADDRRTARRRAADRRRQDKRPAARPARR